MAKKCADRIHAETETCPQVAQECMAVIAQKMVREREQACEPSTWGRRTMKSTQRRKVLLIGPKVPPYGGMAIQGQLMQQLNFPLASFARTARKLLDPQPGPDFVLSGEGIVIGVPGRACRFTTLTSEDN